MKKCFKCKNDKDLSLFPEDTKCGDRLSSWCKECWKKYVQLRRSKFINKESIISRIKEGNFNSITGSSRLKNIVIEITNWMPADSSMKQRFYHIQKDKKEIEKCLECDKNKIFMNYKFEYGNFCSKECKHEEWKRRRKIDQAKQAARYMRTIPHIIMWRNVLKNSLKALGKKKEGRTVDLLGYSVTHLKDHLEKNFKPGMSWNNYGNGKDKWNIDHKKPVSKFDKNTPANIVNELSNLQPMWALDNIKKGNKY